MTPHECRDGSDSVDTRQMGPSRLKSSCSEIVDQYLLSDQRPADFKRAISCQIPRHRLNQCNEDVEHAVSWDELTGRK